MFIISLLGWDSGIVNADHSVSPEFQSSLINIRNTNGKFYAYIVLLFNENPHFLNLIQEDSITLKMMQKEGFHILEYKNYIHSVREPALRKLVELMRDIYLNPKKYDSRTLQSIEDILARRNIILRFSRDTSMTTEKIILDYCIYGKKKLIKVSHPLFHIREKIYNIQPLIYYDEFSTSNSTFYFDMIYINPEEVQNDYIIARNVLMGKNVDTMFFVGAKVSEDIQYCLKKAFTGTRSIKQEIWKMFEIHEITHKILNNHYNYFDQVTGEEIALSSTIYSNPYLGLSVMYSYLDYNAINPHRLAALNFIKYVASVTGKSEYIDNPSEIKHLTAPELEKLAKNHFYSVIKTLK